MKSGEAWVPGGQMKGSKTFGFPLSQEAVQVLREARLLNPHGLRVFQYEGKPIGNFNTKAVKKGWRARSALARPTAHGRVMGRAEGRHAPETMVLGGWKSYSMVLPYAHLSPACAAGAARVVGTSVAQALRRKKVA